MGHTKVSQHVNFIHFFYTRGYKELLKERKNYAGSQTPSIIERKGVRRCLHHAAPHQELLLQQMSSVWNDGSCHHMLAVNKFSQTFLASWWVHIKFSHYNCRRCCIMCHSLAGTAFSAPFPACAVVSEYVPLQFQMQEVLNLVVDPSAATAPST